MRRIYPRGVFFTFLFLYFLSVCAKDHTHIEYDSSADLMSFPQLKTAVEEAKLVVSESYINDSFGNAVSVSGDYAVIGVSSDDFMESSSGTAYIYYYDGSNWVQTQRLIASDAGAGHRFGTAVSLSGNQLVIGASGAGVNGQVYVFEFDGSSWLESQILTPTGHAGFGKNFGNAVSLSANRILVGSPSDTESGASGGAAYIFDYDGMSSSWVQTQKLLATGASAYANFGSSVSLYGFTAVIGALSDENSGVNNGSAYIFDLNIGNNTWSQSQKIFDAGGLAQDGFGYSVSLYGTNLVVGAWRNNSNGSASVYEYDGGNNSWMFLQKIVASDGMAGDGFGVSVSHSNNRIIVGAYQDDEPGIANNLGSAYVFDFDGVDTYVETQKLTPDDGGSYNKAYGIAVALDRDTMTPDKAFIGAYGDDDMADAAGSAYVVSYDGISWSQEQKLIAGDGILNDQFGKAVDIWGDTAVVGAYSDQDLGVNAGAVYIFDYINSNWVLSQKIYGSDTTAGDYFGYSVSLGNGRLVIGAQGDSDNGVFSGSVYVFEHDGTNWQESHKLSASDGATGDAFGGSVGLSADRILIGARFDNSGAGSAYVFDYDSVNDIWNEVVPKLTASDGLSDDNFGNSVSLDGDNALIGAWADDDRGDKSGTAYIFNFDGTDWNELPKLSPPDTNAGDYFGFSVGIEGDWAIVGAPNEDDGMGSAIGAAYVFYFDGVNWNQSQRLTEGVGAEHLDSYGSAIDISANNFVIGSYRDNELGQYSGSAFTYKFNGVNWSFDQKLTASDGAANDLLGIDVGLSGNRVLLGASGDDNNWIDDGAAYIVNIAKRYDLFVNVSGLEPGNEVAFTNGNDSVTVSSDSQQLLSNLADTSNYNVSITSQPTFPDQVCSFDDPQSGTINGSDVIIDVICTTIQFDLSVRVYGIAPGNSIEVTNNLGDNLTLDTHGEIKTFPTQVDHRDTYTIDLISPQPTTPNQTCTTTSSGVMTGDVLRSFYCTTNQYSVSVEVTGLISGSEIVLQNNGGDNLNITNDGNYNFPTLLDDESDYNVTILTQPQSPIQECSVNSPQGQLAGSDVVLDVTCEPSLDLIYKNGFDPLQ